MPDQTLAPVLQQQTELLREIRDEIRTSATTAAAQAGVAVPSKATSAGLALRAQALSDRILASQFADFSWTQAFGPMYRTSLVQDFFGVLGLSRAPTVLTQYEYQQMALENLGLRVHHALAGVLAPSYTRQIMAMTNEIFSNSPRWVRAGDSSSPLGVGLSRTESLALAQRIHYLALGDLRAAPADYATIATVGMQVGQFDFVQSSQGFLGALRELASATVDVTRTLRLSAEEAARTFGALRASGIMGYQQQRDILMQVGAAAAAAGVSPGEMLPHALSAGTTGQALGLGFAPSMVGYAEQVARIRALTAANVLDRYVVARGGGALNVAANVFSAEAQFAASDLGVLSMLGARGGQAGFLAAAVGGLTSVAGRGFFGMLEYERLRPQIGRLMTDAERRAAMLSFVEQYVSLLGVRDMTSPEAQSAAFMIARSLGLDEPAAEAYVAERFTPAGRLLAETADLRTARARRAMERKLMADAAFAYASVPGRIRAAEATVARWWQTAVDAMTHGPAALVSSPSGILGWDPTSTLAAQVDAASYGANPGEISAVSLARGLHRPVREDLDRMEIFGVDSALVPVAGVGAGLLAGVGGALAGAAAGAKIATVLATPFPVAVPLALAAGSVVGGVFGAVLGNKAGSYAGMAAAAALVGPSSTVVQGPEARAYRDLLSVSQRLSTDRGLTLLQDGPTTALLAGNDEFQALYRTYATKTGRLSAEDARKIAMSIDRIHQDTKINYDDLAHILASLGVPLADIPTATRYSVFGDTQTIKDTLQDLFKHTHTPVDVTPAERASALKEYLKSVSETPGLVTPEMLRARARLTRLGFTPGDLEALRARFMGYAPEQRQRVGDVLEKLVGGQVSIEIGDLVSYMLSRAAEAIPATDARLQDRLSALRFEPDKLAVIERLMTDEELGRAVSSRWGAFEELRRLYAVDIHSREAEQLARRFHISERLVSELRSEIEHQTASTSSARAALVLEALRGQRAGAEQTSESDPYVEMSENLKIAAERLHELAAVIRELQR